MIRDLHTVFSYVFWNRKENLTEILRHRLRPCTHEFITTFEALREDVFLEMAHYEEVEGDHQKRITYITLYDLYLNKLWRGMGEYKNLLTFILLCLCEIIGFLMTFIPKSN